MTMTPCTSFWCLNVWPDCQERAEAECGAIMDTPGVDNYMLKYNTCASQACEAANAVRTRTMIVGGVAAAGIIALVIWKVSK